MPHLVKNMKQIITLLLISGLVGCSESTTDCNYITDYYPKIYEAELHYYQKDYQRAFEIYTTAFNSCEPKNTPVHNEINKYSEICAILGKDELALKFIKKRIDQGSEIKWIQQDPIYDRVLNSENGKKLVLEYEQSRADYLSNINLQLRNELQRMIELDQQHNMTPAKDSMFRANDNRLVEIFEEYGYPNGEVIGGYNIDRTSSNPHILLLHSSDSIRLNYFIPKMLKFVKDGAAPPQELGSLYDNLELFNGNPQTHGTYEGSELISSLSEVDANRQRIGLPTLEIAKKLDSLRQE